MLPSVTMRGWRAFVLGIPAALAAISSCTSTANLSGGADDAGVETGADASSDSSGGGPDGATDAADANAFDAWSSCAADAGQIFCDDFDHGVLGQAWTKMSAGPGSLTLDNDISHSAPYSLVATADVTGAYAEGPALTKDFSGTFDTVSCTFAFRRDGVGDARIEIADLAVTTGPTVFRADLLMGPTDGYLEVFTTPSDGGPTTGDNVTAPLAFVVGTWHELTMTIDRKSATLLVDGALAGKLDHGNDVTPASWSWRIGTPVIDTANATPWQIRFDDVRCFRTP